MQAIRIDHVHVEVTDRYKAAEWYRKVLGLVPHDELAAWAEDPMGPLILKAADGAPALSLFQRGCAAMTRDATIAFKVSGDDFLNFCHALDGWELKDPTGKVLSAKDVVDHDLSWSIYFVDPDQNRFEVTTYDYGHVAAQI